MALILLFLLLFTVTLSLEAARWAPGLSILFPIFLMAFGLGLLFAKSRLSGLLLHPLALALGAGWLAYVALDLATEAPWEDQLAELILRVIWWGQAFASGTASSDTLPFVLLMGALIWFLIYSAVWCFYRERNIWGVLIPSGVTIIINTYYSSSELTVLLIFYLIFAFLFVIRTNLLEQEERWRSSDIFYSNDIHLDFFREGAIFAVTILALAWFLPTAISNADVNPFLTRIGQPWGRAQQEWNRLFSSLNYQGRTGSGTWFGTSMTFHGPLNRSNRLVMTVRAAQGRYWRAIVLDEYTSAGWTLSDQRPSGDLSLEQLLASDVDMAGRTQVQQQYTIFAPAGVLLFAAGQPVNLNLPATALLSGEQATPDALSQLYARQPLYQGQSYTAISAVPTVDEQSLRASGTDYPDRIAPDYLSLPATVPASVHDLAKQLAGDAPTPYDAARRIEAYLRQFPYNEAIAGPNPGEDGVEYFLFREQQGYCDYYASAMAVMLRSLGIPARLAQGYTRGTPLPTGEFEVRQTNAHTWVEVYFPGYGWVEFEPTASEPSLDRPLVPIGEEDAAVPSLPSDSNDEDILAEMEELRRLREEREAANDPGTQTGPLSVRLDPRVLLLPAGVLALAGVVGLAGWGLAQRRWRGLEVVERMFDQLLLLGRAVGQRPDPTLTPQEHADRIGEQVPTARPPLTRLASLFSKHRFSGTPLADEELAEARNSWLDARRTLLRGALERLKPRPRAPQPTDPHSARRRARKGKDSAE